MTADAGSPTLSFSRDGGRVWKGWWYETADATIWGATGFMLHAFLELARETAPWLTS